MLTDGIVHLELVYNCKPGLKELHKNLNHKDVWTYKAERTRWTKYKNNNLSKYSHFCKQYFNVETYILFNNHLLFSRCYLHYRTVTACILIKLDVDVDVDVGCRTAIQIPVQGRRIKTNWNAEKFFFLKKTNIKYRFNKSKK